MSHVIRLTAVTRNTHRLCLVTQAGSALPPEQQQQQTAGGGLLQEQCTTVAVLVLLSSGGGDGGDGNALAQCVPAVLLFFIRSISVRASFKGVR